MVTMRLGQVQSQWENAAFPQFSSVFMGKTPIFAGFWAIEPLKPAFGAGLELWQDGESRAMIRAT
jgi:hypothetical protein